MPRANIQQLRFKRSTATLCSSRSTGVGGSKRSRCSRRSNRDPRRYLHWVFEAKKRFGLSVLNYVVTCNHIHLLVKDTGRDVIAQSMQLIAGRTAQEYNQTQRARRGVLGRCKRVVPGRTTASS